MLSYARLFCVPCLSAACLTAASAFLCIHRALALSSQLNSLRHPRSSRTFFRFSFFRFLIHLPVFPILLIPRRREFTQIEPGVVENTLNARVSPLSETAVIEKFASGRCISTVRNSYSFEQNAVFSLKIQSPSTP